MAFLTAAAFGADGDISGIAIETNGWIADVFIASALANTNGIFFNGLGATNSALTGAETLVLTVVSMGYSNAAPVTRLRRVYGNQPVRLPYPYQAYWDTTNRTGALMIKMSLSDYVCAKDSNITATVLAGLYTGNALTNRAASSIAVTNNSVLPYPKVIANWLQPNWDQIPNGATAYELRCAAFDWSAANGQPVESVVFSAQDAHSHVVRVTNTTPVAVWTTNSDIYVIKYAALMNCSPLTARDVVTNNFAAYPAVGDSGSVCDTSDGANGQLTPYYHWLEFMNNKDGSYSSAVALVTAGAGSGTVITTPLDTNYPPPAFGTIAEAAAAIQAANRASFGHNDCGGGTIYLTSGCHYYGQVVDAPSATYLTIGNYPGNVAPAFITNGVASSRASAIVKLDSLSITSNNDFTFCNCKAWWFNNCGFDARVTTALIDKGIVFFTGNTVTNLDQGLVAAETGLHPWTLIYGNNLMGKASMHSYTVVGNWVHPSAAQSGAVLSTSLSGLPYFCDRTIIAYNKFMNINPSGGTMISLYNGAQTCTNGLAIVQNIFEFVEGDGGGVLAGIKSDLTTGQSTNVLIWNNVWVGERVNLAYNDNGTAPLFSQFWSVKNNIFDHACIKSDTFIGTGGAQGTRYGNWAPYWGVGYSGNLSVQKGGSLGAAYDFAYRSMGLNSAESAHIGDPPTATATISALFVSDGSWLGIKSVNGTGNGDYHLQAGSPASSIAMDLVLPYDLEGQARHAYGAAGVYGAAAPSLTLTAIPAAIAKGQSANLFWTSADASNLTWVGFGPVSLNGNAGVWPNTTTTYTVTAAGPGGTNTASATVIVNPVPSVTLTAIPTTITNGQYANLFWTSANATNLTWVGFGPVSLSGNAGVWPSMTTTYSVVATGPGGTNSASATVTVSGSSLAGLPTTTPATAPMPEPSGLPAVVIESKRIVGPGRFQISFTAQVGQGYDILVSTDERLWLTVGSVTATGPMMTFVDAGAAGFPWRFYRVVQHPPGPNQTQSHQ